MKNKMNFSKALNIMLALALSVMATLVFANVILRYLFNTGITWSEEVARYMFVWLTLLGAIGALKDNQHLGVDFAIKKLPPRIRRIVFLISNVIVLYVLWLVFQGSWKLTVLNQSALSPALGIPMSFVYASGIVLAIGMAIITLNKMFKVFFQNVPVETVEQITGTEEEIMASNEVGQQVKAPNVPAAIKVGEM